MKKLLVNLALLSLGALAFAGATLIPPMSAQAAADAAPASPGFDWAGTALLIGAIGAGLGMVLAGVAAVLHAIAARTKNATVEAVAKDVDLAHEKLDELRGLLAQLAPVLGQPGPSLAESVKAGVVRIQPDGTITGVPPRDKQAGRVRRDVLAWIAGIGFGAAALIAGGLTVVACTATQARQTAAAGVVAALVCEDGHLDANALADAKAFAAAKVQQWLTGGSKPSSAAIRADLAPIKSDLGRCAITGALAAATTAVAPTPGVAVSALTSGSDPAQVRAAFGIAAREEGWPLVVLAGGTAI